MRSLVWTFWLAMILAVVGSFATSLLVLTQWHRFETYSQAQGSPHVMLQTLAAEIEQVLTNETRLRSLLEGNAMSEYGRVYLIDPSGADVLRRPIPDVIAASSPILPASDNQERTPPAPPIFARAIRSTSGEIFFMIFRFDPLEHPVWALFRWFGLTWVLVASIVVSGVVSAWLASIVIRPIKALVSASRRQGEGQLDTLIDNKLLRRKDEIGALARQLKSSATKIQHLMQQQRDFLRDVSHEVRTPLARLQVATESVEFDAGDKRALQHIQREVEVIDQLVQDLLHLSHFDRPFGHHKIQKIRMSELLSRCSRNADVLAQRKRVSIDERDADPRLCVSGVEILLERAIDNLLTNAVRHAPEGTVIQLQSEQREDSYSITVCDQGPGVPEESLSAIFEPFVRLDSARRRETGGFGLGLPLVRRIVEFHQGTITASNNDPCGFCVNLTIPIEGNLCSA